jgi:amino acid transporter
VRAHAAECSRAKGVRAKADVHESCADPYHPRTAARRGNDAKLRTRDATAMAVGGMIGGGIFSVLGVAITLAGHLAFGAFVVGGIVAALTARSFAHVTARAGTSGGPFEHLRLHGHHQIAGTLLWLLVCGYMVAMAVYSFTFGHYAAEALGAPAWVARLLVIAVLAAFLAVNLRGVRLSSIAEDIIVLTKLVILGGIGLVGIAHFTPDRLTPVANSGLGGMFLGAATIFFAYEGFELICYDRDDMVDPARTLPLSLYASVGIVAAIYIGVTLGSQMLVADDTIVANKATAFVAVGRAALGEPGRWAAIIGALFATGSAINATLFSCARLIRDASTSGDLPPTLGRITNGVPVVAMTFISVVGVAMAMLPGITTVIVFGSAAFLAIYTVVNGLEATTASTTAGRVIAVAATVACLAAIAALIVELVRDDRGGLVTLLAIASAIALGRLTFVRASRHD